MENPLSCLIAFCALFILNKSSLPQIYHLKVRYTYAPYEDHRCISVRKINLHDVHMCIKVNLPFLYSNAILTDFRVSSFSCLILLFYTTGWITTQTFTYRLSWIGCD